MRGIVLVAMALFIQGLQAQPLARHNLYPFNPDFANPAATGLTDCLVFNATDMHQWVGIRDAPNIQSFSVQNGSPVFRTRRQGIGLNLIRDVNGPSKSTGGEILYSFQVMIGQSQSTWLSFGLSVNCEQNRLDESGFSPVFDPHVSGGMEQEIAYNASSGVYLFHERYFAGVAVYNLLPVSTSLGRGYGGDPYYVSFQGGYLFTGLEIPASFQTCFQGSLGKGIYQFDLAGRLGFDNHVWTGLTLRKYAGEFSTSGQNVLVFFGYEWNKWNFAYCYNFDINGTQFHHYGTHQFSLGYRICRNIKSCPVYE